MKKVLFLLSLLILAACSSSSKKLSSSKIYFWSNRDGQMQIYTMNPDGSDQQKVSDLPNLDFSYAKLSPDHQYIAVVREKEKHYSIFVLTINGEVVGSSSPNYETYDDLPDWSPESKYITFTSDRDGYWKIYTMKYDGTEIKRLTNISSQVQTCPVWSPDGQKIAFQSGQKTMAFDDYFMNVDGSDVQNFGVSTSGSGYYCPPISWSPDSKWVGRNGTEILYLESMYDKGFASIHIVSPDLSGLYFTNVPPVWSPDGKKLLFTMDTHEPTHHSRDEVYIVGIDGTMLMNLTDNDSANDTNPLWSGNSEYIVFESNRTGNYEIFRMKTDGSELTQLTNNVVDDKLIAWE